MTDLGDMLAACCTRCGHPPDWHRLDDAENYDPIQWPPFRCLGYDPSVDGPASSCDCPDFISKRRYP